MSEGDAGYETGNPQTSRPVEVRHCDGCGDRTLHDKDTGDCIVCTIDTGGGRDD